MTYASQTISGFNDDAPSNDGAQTTANQVDWDKHINEIGTPLKNLAEGINSAMVAHADTRFCNSKATFSTTTTFDGNDEGTMQVFTGSSATTATLPGAGTVGAGFVLVVINRGSATLTLDGAGSETIAGASSKDFAIGQGAVVASDGTNWEITAAIAPPDSFLATGFVNMYTGTSAPSGWVMLDRTSIGDAGSSADDASADNEALFNHLHGAYSDTQCPVLEASAGWQTISSVSAAADTLTITSHSLLSNAKVVLLDGGGATAPGGLLFNRVYYVVTATADTLKLSATSGPGSAINITSAGSGTLKLAEVSKATAAADWAAGKILIVEDWRGRSPFGVGTGEDGSGGELTARALGDRDGAEDHTLTAAQMPTHTHLMFTSDNPNPGTQISGSVSVARQGGAAGDYRYDLLAGSSSITDGVSGSAGSGNAHNNMPPYAVCNFIIKK